VNDEVFVVIGAGQAGIQVCNTLRNSGFAGKLILIGDETILPYQRPPLSKSFLLGDIDEQRLFFRPQAHFEKQSIKPLLGVKVIGIDRVSKEITLEGDTTLNYTKLALTTGTRVRKLDCEGANSSQVHYIRSLEDSIALRNKLAEVNRVAIIGGGFVGLEVAAVTRKLGKAVTVYEAEDRLMGRVVSPMLSEFYSNLHRNNDVSLRLSERIDKVEMCGDSLQLYANEQHSLDCDIIVAGIGAIANDKIALEAGLRCDRGIVVDNRCLTSDPDIVAAGDCTVHFNKFAGKVVRLESVQNAVDQAKVAALTMLNGHAIYEQVPWFWSDQYDAKLQIAGISAGYDEYLTLGRIEDSKFSIFYFKDDALIAADSINDPSSHMAVRKIMATKIASMAQIQENLDDLKSFAKQ
jgi:3-phenylpropionate/trans-cinnamate dioxygenase ferredoxin reductase subunit